MPEDFKSAQVVKIHRPNKQLHGAIGRYIEAGQTPGFGWVSISKADPATVPPEATYRKSSLFGHKLFPLSQILPHEPEPSH